MEKKPLIIIGNEKVFKSDSSFYCDRYDEKSIPEGLSKYNEIYYIARSLNKKGDHKVNLKNIKVSKNIFLFIYSIIKTFKISDASYLLISITPYTFFSFFILFIFRKKIFVYLRSSGHEEYKYILGSWAVGIYHFMYKIVTSKSNVIVCDYRLHDKNKSHLVLPSKLDSQWMKDQKVVSIDEIKFLYVGRINPEKGIIEFFKMFDELKLNARLSVVSKIKNLKDINKNIEFLGHGFDVKSLIKIYDDHNITILPSFTEGHPHIVDESLSRKRPVIIFEEIAHIVKDKKGIFVSKRNIDSFSKTVKYVMQNYKDIQKEIEKNKLPTQEDFFKKISNIISINVT